MPGKANGWAAKVLAGVLVVAGIGLTGTAIANRVSCAVNDNRITTVEKHLLEMAADLKEIRRLLEDTS